MTLNEYESFLLFILPFAFGAKSIAFFWLWIDLRFRYYAQGRLGDKINMAYRETAWMSVLHTWLAWVLFRTVDANDIVWPAMSVLLTGLAFWPIRVTWVHFQLYIAYRAQRKLPGAIQ